MGRANGRAAILHRASVFLDVRSWEIREPSATILKREGDVAVSWIECRSLALSSVFHPPSYLLAVTMSYLSRSEERGQEAAEPLFRDSEEAYEKRLQQDEDASAEQRRLQASVRRLRAWLIAVSIMLGIACLYLLYGLRGSLKDYKVMKQLSFAPQSMMVYCSPACDGH